jgi:hypothetical protein
VWLGITAGAIGCQTTADCPSGGATCNAGACTCAQDADCAPIGQCSPDNHHCFWQLPTLGASQLELAQGASATVCFQAPVAGQSTQWSGNLWARTGCDASGQGCATGECGSASGQPCPVGHGGAPPVALAEFTLSNQSVANPASDFYDVSIINGINVPVSMAPFPGTFAAHAGDPYSCGSPGAPTAAAPLGGCSWNVQPTVGGVDETTWVRDVRSGSFARSCGVAVGWWTADQICGTDPTFGAPFDCAATVANHDGSSSTYTNLFACNGAQAQSCYSAGASVDCCGCGTDSAGWPGVLGAGFACSNDNPSWEAHAAPWLLYLKKACPTAYTYPFDDATSTFTCQPGASTPPVAYTVTFCP